MWKKIMRCSKDVTLVVQHGKKLLGLDERCSDRFTSVIPEIVKWRAYLRYSGYRETDSIQVVNMSGEPLNNSLVDFSHIHDAKRREYWKQGREGVPLESIRYQNVNILVDAEVER